ncbi:MAG: hypothetical protein II570_05560, partial [Bacteroidaceae bacterium]|nr:hypothetical protein [Bacteroidaceae bacterium]
TAMCTGMRIGEIQALQLGDIGSDRIYVRHNWARRDGLKTPKKQQSRWQSFWFWGRGEPQLEIFHPVDSLEIHLSNE